MRIISKPPFILKYVIGPFFFILGLIVAATGLFAPQHTNGLLSSFAERLLFVWAGAATGIYALISGLSFADEVWDAGNEIIVRKSGHRERIPLANIISLTHKKGRPPCSFLTLRVPCRFGYRIKFITMLRGGWSLEPDPAIYDDLSMRINEARRQVFRKGMPLVNTQI